MVDGLSFREPLKRENIFMPNEPYSIDIGPVWLDKSSGQCFEGDYGDTFIFGENKAALSCIVFTRDLFFKLKQKWFIENMTGKEMYNLAVEICNQNDYILTLDFDGHRVSKFSHTQITQLRLAELDFAPSSGEWILELHVRDKANRFGAFFEDLLC